MRNVLAILVLCFLGLISGQAQAQTPQAQAETIKLSAPEAQIAQQIATEFNQRQSDWQQALAKIVNVPLDQVTQVVAIAGQVQVANERLRVAKMKWDEFLRRHNCDGCLLSEDGGSLVKPALAAQTSAGTGTTEQKAPAKK